MKNRSITPMRTAKWGYILISIVLSLVGVLMIVNPEISGKTISIILGCILIAFGIIKVIGYFSKDLFRLAFQYDLQLGVITSLLGIVVVVRSESVLNILFVLIGIWIIVDCAFKMQTALEAKKFGISSWWVNMLFSVISGLLGLMMVFSTTAFEGWLIRLFGLLLLAEGIRNLLTAVTCIKIVKYQKPDIIDIEYNEMEEQ